MEPIVIYDILNEGYTEWGTLIKVFISIIIIIVGQQIFSYYLGGRRIKFKNLKWSIIMLLIYLIFAMVVIVTTYPKYYLAKMYRMKNQYKIVTGKVINIEVTYGKIPTQKFYVNDILFKVEDGGYHPGYNKTIQRGAPFYNGKCIKILYAKVGNENTILRLEVLQDKECK